MKRNIYILLLAGVLVGCGRKASEKAQTTARDWGETVTWATVEERPVEETLLLSGDIVADERRVSRVVVPIGGRMQGIAAETGDRVERGARLAVVSSSEAAEYQRETAAAQSEVRLAQRDLAMKEQLLQDGMASDKEVEEARERLRMAEAALQQQQAIAGIYGMKDNDSRPSQVGTGGGSAKGSSALLTAPTGGIVLSRQVYNDQFVEAGTEAFVLADLSRVWAVADVYESDISRIREGAAVTVEVMAWPGETFGGRIDKVYGALSDESKTMKVRIDLDNPDGRLRPGMFASVRVVSLPEQPHTGEPSPQGGTRGGLLPCVPAEAVVFENGHHYVIVTDGAVCRRQEVRVATTADGMTFLREGIAPGQRVAVRNALLVFNQLGQ